MSDLVLASTVNRAIPAVFAGLLVSAVSAVAAENDFDALLREDAALYTDAPSSAFSQMEMSKLKDLVIADGDAVSIQTFLAERPDVYRVLLAATIEIRVYFGERPELLLEIVSDYEDEDDTTLFVKVVDDQESFEDMYEKYSEFEQGWWLDNMSKSRGMIDIGLA
jgi:hypothetical protein